MGGTPTRNGEPVLPEAQNRLYRNLRASMGRRIKSALSHGVTTLVVVPEGSSTEYWEWMARRSRGPVVRPPIEGQELEPALAMSEVILLKPETGGLLLTETGFDPRSGNVEYMAGPMEGVQVSLSLTHDVEPAFVSPNVVGFIPGSDPVLRDEYVLVTAHLDHLGTRGESVFNGADDNASGSAALLEVAEAMAMNPGKRSVLLTAEERGLLGAFAFAGNPPVPMEDTVLNVHLDMIGRDSPSFPEKPLTLVSENGRARMMEMIRQVNEGVGAPLDWELNESVDSQEYLGRSDQYAFMQNGIPAILITRGFEGREYHSAIDDPETINYTKVVQASRLALALVRAAADREEVAVGGSR